MSDQALRTACPACGKLSRHAVVPVPDIAAPQLESAAMQRREIAAMAQALTQRLVCTQCEKMWEAAVVPVEQLAQLQLVAESLVAAKRQIGILRLILAKDQLQRLERGEQETVKLQRAA
jgi:hypothetical protein